jgi:transposase
MANELKMAQIDTILALHRRRWSNRRIAKELGIHRETVARHIQEAASQSKPARAPIGSEPALADAKPATSEGGAQPAKPANEEGGAQPFKTGQAPIGSEPATKTQTSLCEPWRALILDKLEAGLTAQRVYQDLVTEHGFAGKYHSVRRFVGRLGQARALPFRRMECEAGEEAQVDFGSGVPITAADGHRRRTHVFRIVLSHSRKGYSEAVYRQTTDDFLACLENAWWYFGGVPRTLVLDNLKAGVETPDWFDPNLNPKLRSFAAHYGVAILPTRPWTPRHKGKIESGVGYVKKNALKGHAFTSLEEENRHLRHWEETVADTRVHGTTRQQVGKMFTLVERPALQPLPPERFPFFHEGERMVHRDGHVEVARAYYSVPPEYLGRRLWARWDSRVVRLFNQRLEQIALHVRQEPGRFSTQPSHIASEKISSVEHGAAWLLAKTRRIGSQAPAWAEAVIQARGIEGVRVVQGLLSLAKRHPAAALEKACEIAVSYGSYRLRTIRTLLKRQAPAQASFEFMEKHPLIRSLADYAELAHASFQKEAAP